MADFHIGTQLDGHASGKASSNNGKSGVLVASAGISPLCPQCGSNKLWRDGLRYSMFGDKVQRWYCRKCGLRFSDRFDIQKAWSTFERVERVDTKPKKATEALVTSGQICVTKAEGTKNLAAEIQKMGIPPRSEEDIKGKLVEYAFWMQKQGYDNETIYGWQSCLRSLLSENANLLDAESVKEVLAKDNQRKKPRWGQHRRRNIINAYTLFLKINRIPIWEKPRCKMVKKFPFIPTEQEIDALIAGCRKKNAAFTQLLKETAMRPGEAKMLEWTNLDSDRNIITLNEPEKGSNPRMWKVSQRLIGMLNALPKACEQLFPGSLKSMKGTWIDTRARLAETLQNPRLKKITFYTFRHWKATTEYHKTKDILYVQQLLGHREIKNTMIYINIEHTIFGLSSDDEFHVRVTENPEEIKTLLETGFEYVCQKDNKVFLRKRK
jgi:integrase/predicted RNA-binding Zn-ribbon protein involved in translation (DUF1610 family)